MQPLIRRALILVAMLLSAEAAEAAEAGSGGVCCDPWTDLGESLAGA